MNATQQVAMRDQVPVQLLRPREGCCADDDLKRRILEGLYHLTAVS